MSTFKEIFDRYSWEEVKASIYAKAAGDVERALGKSKRDLDDFMALISPAAEPFLEEMAQLSHQLTQKRFGKTIQMYIPMYLSNECNNICTYCGFSLDVDIPRKTLNDEEILSEVRMLKSKGYDHILIVTGEHNKNVGIDYFEHALELIRPHFSHIAMEVQPLNQEEYERLIKAGVHTILLYQETYHKEDYKKHHPKGRKSNFDWRLESHDRIGQAGMYKMGLGILIGLEDWRVDSFFNALHLNYLEKKYWRSNYSISFPRLRPCAGGVELKSVMTDRQLVQLICAYRILNEEVELSLSTRESEKFRDHVLKLGITSMSAESKTDPGGYTLNQENLEQFEIDDARSTNEMAQVIRKQGYEPVFKNWDAVLQ
ncbi:MAG: 2-iminoacetate synthase ThiH [Crocinitomicaceae bacterium]|nr:2-iminoacetate synthase ThiH [Crocinitomicaceae bacterium]